MFEVRVIECQVVFIVMAVEIQMYIFVLDVISSSIDPMANRQI